MTLTCLFSLPLPRKRLVGAPLRRWGVGARSLRVALVASLMSCKMVSQVY